MSPSTGTEDREVKTWGGESVCKEPNHSASMTFQKWKTPISRITAKPWRHFRKVCSRVLFSLQGEIHAVYSNNLNHNIQSDRRWRKRPRWAKLLRKKTTTHDQRSTTKKRKEHHQLAIPKEWSLETEFGGNTPFLFPLSKTATVLGFNVRQQSVAGAAATSSNWENHLLQIAGGENPPLFLPGKKYFSEVWQLLENMPMSLIFCVCTTFLPLRGAT